MKVQSAFLYDVQSWDNADKRWLSASGMDFQARQEMHRTDSLRSPEEHLEAYRNAYPGRYRIVWYTYAIDIVGVEVPWEVPILHHATPKGYAASMEMRTPWLYFVAVREAQDTRWHFQTMGKFYYEAEADLSFYGYAEREAAEAVAQVVSEGWEATVASLQYTVTRYEKEKK